MITLGIKVRNFISGDINDYKIEINNTYYIRFVIQLDQYLISSDKHSHPIMLNVVDGTCFFNDMKSVSK